MSLRSVLLALLSKQPNTGYGLGRLLRNEYQYLWDARLQQIYGELGKLLDEELVQVEESALFNRPPKKLYSLTPLGEAALDAWLSTAPSFQRPKDELLVQLSCHERMPAGLIVRRMEQRRDECAAESAELRAQIMKTSRTDPAAIGLVLGLEAALVRAEARLAWAEKALALFGSSLLPEDRPANVPAASEVSAYAALDRPFGAVHT